ncbi:MAG: branched-chain amino acid transport system II carrier protein [bacterium]
MKKSQIISVGMAMFAMLFGAGNIVFPLVLGRDMGDMLWFGLFGFAITAIIVPILGLVSVMLCDGQYDLFLGRLGKIPGTIIAIICMIVIGPFAITPRCVVISHAGIKPYMPQFTLLYFSIFCAALIYAFTRKQNSVIDIIGKFLAPLKIILLITLIVVGFMFPAAFLTVSMSSGQGFFTGLFTGYKTADLLGIIFFSALILSGIRKSMAHAGHIEPKTLALRGFQAGLIGASLLGFVYSGFCVVAAFYGAELAGVQDGDIFSKLASLVLGSIGGLMANITVGVACLVTAVALTTVFADFLQRIILKEKISYHTCLLITIAITTIMSNLGFARIMQIAGPILDILYPGLIVLAIVNIAHVLFGFKWIKTPVFATFAITLVMQYWDAIRTLIK